MRPLLPVQVNDELREAVAAMVDRMTTFIVADRDGAEPCVAASVSWVPFAGALGFDTAQAIEPSSADASAGPTEALVAVGPIADAITCLPRAQSTGVIGFVAPAAYRRRFWQRGGTRFLDPTRDLWLAGWSPLAVARIDIADHDSTIEVVVGHARPTPEPMRGRNWQPN